MYNVNPPAKVVSFEQFKEKYFRGERVPDKIARTFYSDFRRAFIGSLDKYIRETTEQA
jgi:hypothetical protein